jgi:hypothetical protein
MPQIAPHVKHPDAFTQQVRIIHSMSSNLDRYIPEFDENETRAKLSGFSREELFEMLIYSYKEKRVIAKSWDESLKKLRRIQDILEEPPQLLGMPGVPSADDLRNMFDDPEG